MSERSFAPTKKRMLRARQDGQVFKSQVVTSGTVLTIGIIWIYCLFPSFLMLVPKLLLKFLGTGSFADPTQALGGALFLSLLLVLVSITPCAVLGAFVEGAQLGFRIYFGSGFKSTGRLSVVSGVKRLWSGLSGIWLQAFFITSFGAVLYRFFSGALAQLCRHMEGGHPNPALLILLGKGAILIVTGWIVFCAAVDYSVRRFQHYRRMRMTREELKDEFKESEGDGHLRAYRRSLHRSLVLQDIESRVRRAKVIVVERTCSQTEHRRT